MRRSNKAPPPRLVQQLRKLRIEAKIKQGEMASLIGLDNTALSRVESGKQNATAEILEAYAGALGMELVLIPASASAGTADADISRLDFADRYLLARLARVMKGMPRAAKRLLSAQVDIIEEEQDFSLVQSAD